MTHEYDEEEQFHAKDRKQFRKERKHRQETDRSKFKKTDQTHVKNVIDEKLPRGRVVAITGEGTWVEYEGKRFVCTLKGLLKKERMHAKNLVTVGDWIRFEKTSSSEGIISQIEDRFSFLTRTDISGKKEQLIAANVDQLFIVVSVVEPPLKPALVDRYLIAATKGNIHPIIAINKVDLLSNHAEEEERYQEFLAAYEPLGFPILTLSAAHGTGIEALRSLMKDKTSVVSGQSGVGKSSLLNVAFQLELRTGELAAKTFKGVHTTTTAELLPLPQGGYCVDTPGIRSFALWDLSKDEVFAHYKDIAKYASDCHYPDCRHVAEPHCAVLQALKEGYLPLLRYESYTTLLDEALGGDDNRTKRKQNDA
ncbi:MAG: ribosome small subunit-dependent GTPase A [Verrucomicrobiota bacterium]|nr:ribosome small subunit-dependent GTPase A [Verrucomicrobiota bacterium]